MVAGDRSAFPVPSKCDSPLSQTQENLYGQVGFFLSVTFRVHALIQYCVSQVSRISRDKMSKALSEVKEWDPPLAWPGGGPMLFQQFIEPKLASGYCVCMRSLHYAQRALL